MVAAVRDSAALAVFHRNANDASGAQGAYIVRVAENGGHDARAVQFYLVI